MSTKLHNPTYLKGYYKLNGTVKDYSGNQNHGIITGDAAVELNSLGRQITSFGPDPWENIVEPTFGLNNVEPNLYMQMDDFIANSNDIIIEMDYDVEDSNTGLGYHGIYTDLYLGHWYTQDTSWYFGSGVGITVSGFDLARHRQKIDHSNGYCYIDDVHVITTTSQSDISSATQNFVIWKSINSSTGANYTTNDYSTVYALRFWVGGVLIHQLLAATSGETPYNATSPAPSNCFWDTVGKRYYESSIDALTVVAV